MSRVFGVSFAKIVAPDCSARQFFTGADIESAASELTIVLALLGESNHSLSQPVWAWALLDTAALQPRKSLRQCSLAETQPYGGAKDK